MIEMIKQGKVQGIVAWHPDRLSRNPIDGAEIIYLLDTGKLKDLKFCSYTFENTPEGKMMLQIVMSQSKYSSDKLSVDVKRGMNSKAAGGYRPSRAALGYSNSKTNVRGKETIFNDPVRFNLVKQLWQTMLTGNYTVSAMLKIAKDELHLTQPPTANRPERKLRINVLYNMFTNPFYYGWYKWNGEWIKGQHEPIITEQEFDLVQKILGKAGRPRPKHHKFAFTGLMRCGTCGAMITAQERWKKQQNGNIHHYVHYRCTKKAGKNCPERYVNLNDFNKQVDKILEGLHISDRFQKWSIRYLHELRKDEAQAQESSFEATQQELSKINKQMDNLLLKYTAAENSDGDLISDVDYKNLKGSLIKQKSVLEEALLRQGAEKVHWLELSERTFNFARYARMWFEKGDIDTKRAVFACLGSNLLIKDGALSLTLRKPFKFIFEGLPYAEQELLRLQPLETADNITDFRVLTQKNPVWSG